MKIGRITSGIISPIQTRKQAGIEPPLESTNNVKEQQDLSINATGNLKISTQDFIALRVGETKESPFVELDQAIERINKNIEQLGEALESIIEKIREVSESSIGLQLLQQTFEAIDKIREGTK